MRIWFSKLVLVLGIACLAFAACVHTDTSGLNLGELNFEPAKNIAVSEAFALHQATMADPNQYTIFGNVQAPVPADDLDPGLAVFLGRWEGFDFGPPVSKDYKIVLAVTEILESGGKAYLWLGTNLQYPTVVQEIAFRVLPGKTPRIAFEARINDSMTTLVLDADEQGKRLTSPAGAARQLVLSQNRDFVVYADYPHYLADKGISFHPYPKNSGLAKYGAGYLLYLPEGYNSNPAKTWPLVYFLHGSGDRGDNPYLLAKASPFMMIREMGPLPCIIAAPLLGKSAEFGLFPDNYLTLALDGLLADYRVDSSQVYATGLSLGGEATYRLATLRPDVFAAIAPLSAFMYGSLPLQRIKDLPIRAIHGQADMIIPLAMGQKPVAVLKKLGSPVELVVLPEHDHDTWTDTYLDPEFYAWLFGHRRP